MNSTRSLRGNRKQKKKGPTKKNAMELSSFLGRIVPKKQTNFFQTPYWLECKPLRMQKEPEFVPHEIPVVYVKPETLPDDELGPAPLGFDRERRWNHEYQNILDVLYLKDQEDCPDHEMTVTYRLELLSLQNDFQTLVKYMTQKLVFQLHLPEEKKAIPSLRHADYYPTQYLTPRAGEFLRFKEYVWKGVLYRLSSADVSHGGPFAHEMECSKMLGYQLKGHRSFALAALGSDFHVGLTCVVDFGGYRVRARALMPLSEDDILRQLADPPLDRPPLKDHRFQMRDEVALALEQAVLEEAGHGGTRGRAGSRATGPPSPRTPKQHTFITQNKGIEGTPGHSDNGTPGSPLPQSILSRVLVVNDSPGLNYEETVLAHESSTDPRNAPPTPVSPRIRYTRSEHLDIAAAERMVQDADSTYDQLAHRHEAQLREIAHKLNLSYETRDHDHAHAWRSVVRKGSDDRLYIMEPYLLFPREPPGEEDENDTTHGDAFRPYLRPEHMQQRGSEAVINDLFCTQSKCIDAVDREMVRLYGEKGIITNVHEQLVHYFVDDPAWWSLAADASNVTDLIHHFGLHLDSMGEIRRHLTIQHGELLKDNASEDRLYLQAKLNDVVLAEIGVRSIKSIAQLRLRQGKPKNVTEMKSILTKLLNLILSQSPNSSEFWRIEIGQQANRKFGLSVRLEEDTGTQHIKRACDLNTHEFYQRFETIMGIAMKEKRVEDAVEDPVHFFSILEPFVADDIVELCAHVKGDSIPLHAPTLIALQAEICQDDLEKHTYLDWALEEFMRAHIQHPFSVDNLIAWGRALCEKGIIVARGIESVTISNWSELSDEERLKMVIDSEGFFAKSIEVFKHVHEVAPNNIDALCGWGAVRAHCAWVAREAEFFRDGRKMAREAEELFEKALQIEPDDVRLKTNLGKILVFEATCFAEMSDKKQGGGLGIQNLDLFKKYPIFGKALHVMKQLQQVTKIERGLAILQDCLRADPGYKFARDVYEEGCVVYARIFLEPHDHFIVN